MGSTGDAALSVMRTYRIFIDLLPVFLRQKPGGAVAEVAR